MYRRFPPIPTSLGEGRPHRPLILTRVDINPGLSGWVVQRCTSWADIVGGIAFICRVGAWGTIENHTRGRCTRRRRKADIDLSRPEIEPGDQFSTLCSRPVGRC